jgi:two-component system CheB/CheR fusion protein
VEPRRAPSVVPGRTARDIGLADAAQRWLADAYAPAAVVIGQRYDIQYIHGAVGAYLELPRGEPVLNLLSMVSPDFRGRLRVALHKARASGEPCEITVTYPNHGGTTRVARLSIRAFGESPTGESLLIVTFHDAPRAEVHEAERRPAGRVEEESVVRQLEAEIAATKGDLQGTIEAVEMANEELRASNEEIMSMNEEFRSTNEELETSKEELQSLNEELSTVNSELREKVGALEVVTNDLTNLLASTDIPTLFLGSALHIRRFSSASKLLLNLIPSDVGRPLSDISAKFHDDTLVQDIEEVMSSLAPGEKEIRSHAGQRYLRRIRPYRTADNRIDGVVITFVDIETMKAADDKVRTARRDAEEIIDTLREPLLVLNSRFVVQSANGAYYEKFKAKPDDTVGRSVYSLGGGQWNLPAFRKLLEQTMRKQVKVRDVELEPSLERLGTRTVVINSRRLRHGDDDGEELIILAIEDVTETKRQREVVEQRVKSRTAELERSTENLRHINESLDAFSHVVGHDLKEPARAVESLLHVLQEDHGTALSPAAHELLANAREANERLSRLIEGLLALSRASRIDFPNMRAVGIAAALASETCWTRYKALLVERHASIEPADPDVFVHATPESLCQILGNLVLNAIKHNPHVEPRIRVYAALAPAGDMVEVVVEDNGKGFPGELVAGFEKMSSATRGFGLIIAKRTVENLGGRLWLGQAEGGGGAVHFTLHAPPTT